jgi:hypothetical protein
VQQQQLERAVADAQAARSEAERRLRDSECQMCDMRSALDSQERLLVVLREQVAQGGAAASRAGELQGAVQVGFLCGSKNQLSRKPASDRPAWIVLSASSH